MWSIVFFLSVLHTALAVVDASGVPAWRFDLKQTPSGIVALESIVVSPSLVLFFDRASDDPLQINNHSAWGALWDLETSTVRALDVLSDSFCASGALISNGSMVSVGGNMPAAAFNLPALTGYNAIRIFAPCADPSGANCTLFEDPQTVTLAAPRWYPSSIRIFDGSLMIIGGTHVGAAFYNIDPENSFEFFPKKDGGAVRPSAFLERSLPSNLFPRAFALPDGRVFMVANNQSIIYDIEKNEEIVLPDIPNNVRVTNPIDGSGILLPLSPPLYTPEVLICGGAALDPDTSPVETLSSQFPATSQCSRIELTEEGIKAGWTIEHMLGGRIMPELVHVPNGQVLVTNGGRSGFAALNGVKDPIGNSNADHPVLTPELYTVDAALGKRFSNAGMPTSDVARMYHSSVTLTAQGNFLVAGSNPNNRTVVGPDVVFPSEFRVQTLDPPYMFVERPTLGRLPEKLAFGKTISVDVTVPAGLDASKIQVSLMDLGFSSHAFHSSARLVFMDAKLSRNQKTLTFTMPPNGRVYPPGPATVFLTVDGVTSPGTMIMAGSGSSPPTLV